MREEPFGGAALESGAVLVGHGVSRETLGGLSGPCLVTPGTRGGVLRAGLACRAGASAAIPLGLEGLIERRRNWCSPRSRQAREGLRDVMYAALTSPLEAQQPLA
jgi:hypothetical protein